MAPKYVFDFVEGSRDMRDLLGGKGANVAEMTRVLGPDRVPSGFTITTEACVAYMNRGGRYPDGLTEEVEAALGLAARSGNERFAWDSYRRLVQMFANVVRDVPGERLQAEIDAVKAVRGVRLDTELNVDELRELVERFKRLLQEATGEAFPQDPHAQLHAAISAVFGSWLGERAVSYRRINRIPDDWGTAVNVQQMVFGNLGETSATGVAFSRDEVTGAPEPSGDFLVNAQGEDVVSGVRNTRELAELGTEMPDAYAQLMEILRTLERHYADMQDVEFTIQRGQLYM